MSRDTRRQFLKTSAAVGGSFLIMGTRASGKAVGANNRMRIGVCGVNGSQYHVHSVCCRCNFAL